MAQTRETQASITPARAIALLEEGNRRFASDRTVDHPWRDQVQATTDGQYPFAVVFGCIDSRVPVEAVFDVGIGDIFAVRVAGNVPSVDVLGSMEFACQAAGARAVVVLGHTSCGAVEGAIQDAGSGNLTALLEKIHPAIDLTSEAASPDHHGFVDAVAETNVRMVLRSIREHSEVLAGLETSGEILLRGAMYDVSTGQVRFLD